MKPVVNLLPICFIFFLVACHPNREQTGPSTPTPPTANVRVEKAALQEISEFEEVVGTVRARTRATIEAKHPGRILKFPAKLGDTIRVGELVVELDAVEATARVEQAQASAEQAERDWKRVSSLFEAQSATRSERDAAESRLKVAQAALTETRASLGQMRIAAPFNGVVTKKWAEAGDLATPGKALLDLENPSVLQVEVDIPESLRGELALNSKLFVAGDNSAGANGVVVELSPAFDPVTRTRRAKLELNGGSFAPGQFVRVSIPTGQRKAILAPQAAIVERGQLEMIFVLEKQHARMRLVKVRPLRDGVEVLSGLNAGEFVIVEGAERLLDGQPVEVK